jgi:hypothetical protein
VLDTLERPSLGLFASGQATGVVGERWIGDGAFGCIAGANGPPIPHGTPESARLDEGPPSMKRILSFALLLVGVFRAYENIFYQFNQNMIDEVVWAGWKHRITRYFWQPGVQAWWPSWRHDCHPDFREFLETSSRPSEPVFPKSVGGLTDPAA